MKVLPNDTYLGRLKFFEIYEDLMGPKCFSVRDELGHLYLVYWSGDYDEGNCTKWIYLPISQSKLDELIREELSFHQVFSESRRLMLLTVYKNKASNFESITEENRDSINLPPKDFSFDPEEIQSIAPESQWDFNLRIAKNTEKGSKPTDSVITKILDAFGDIVRSLMKADSQTAPSLFPLTATYGSFDVKLGTNNRERAAVAIELFDKLLVDMDSIEESLAQIEMDPYRLKNLLDIVNLNKIELTLKAKTSDTLNKSITITPSQLLPVIKKLEQMTLTIIDSQKVPQANKLERLIDIVKLRVEGEELTIEKLPELCKRQIRYYTHAAHCLGLLNSNLTITSAGRVLAQKTSRTAQYQFLADRVESSDFGWAWMKWAKVTSLSDLDEKTAEAFITECVKGLHRGTIPRRASGLEQWIRTLKKYRREYGNDLPEAKVDC